MNSDAKLLKRCITEYVASAPDKVKRQKEKVFRKGVLADFTNEITKDWYIADLFDVTHLITCGVAKRPEYVEVGIPFLSAQNARPFKANLNKIRYIDKETFEKITVGGKPEKDDILYTRVGNCGEAAKITYDFDFGVYVSLTLIKPVRELLDSDYFVAFLNSRFGLVQAGQGAIGIGLKNLNVDNVRRYIIPLPPLAEQKKIATKINELLAQVDTIKNHIDTILTILKCFRQSVLAAAVSGKLTEEWREEHDVSLNDWRDSSVGNISVVATGKTPKRTDTSFWIKGNVPWLTSTVTGSDYCYRADQFVTKKAVKECSLKLFEKGTLLLAMYGEGKTRGQVTELKITAACNQACAAIIVDTSKVSKSFIKLRLKENYEEIRKAASGGNQPNLNLNKVRDIKIQLPSLEEQTEVISKVEQYFILVNQVEQRVKEAQALVNNLTQSILSKAFCGELTAEWREKNRDLISGENSAEALLEKIEIAREAIKPSERLKRKK